LGALAVSKKPRDHFCKICHQRKSNEKFSGRGHAAHICKACAKRGNKPPEIKDEPLVFIDEDYIDVDDYLFGGGDYFFHEYFLLNEEQPAPKKKKRKPNKAKQLRAEQKKAAKALLSKMLVNGDVSASTIMQAASKANIPIEALRRAKGSLSIKSEGGVWRLPQHIRKQIADKNSAKHENREEKQMPKLFYQGHGSFRLTTNDGTVIYVDPYAGEGYNIPADIILVSHQHGDHNQVQLCAQKSDCKIITNEEALTDGKHNSFTIGGITIQATVAYNKNHDPKQCVVNRWGQVPLVRGFLVFGHSNPTATLRVLGRSGRKPQTA